MKRCLSAQIPVMRGITRWGTRLRPLKLDLSGLTRTKVVRIVMEQSPIPQLSGNVMIYGTPYSILQLRTVVDT